MPVIGMDPSESLLAYTRRHVTDPWAEFLHGDAAALPVADAAFDVVISGLVPNFVPDQRQAAAAMRRAARLNGTVAAYV
jgi:ubiquinone/menaquinone biosynthesis C-methylase UbiE